MVSIPNGTRTVWYQPCLGAVIGLRLGFSGHLNHGAYLRGSYSRDAFPWGGPATGRCGDTHR